MEQVKWLFENATAIAAEDNEWMKIKLKYEPPKKQV